MDEALDSRIATAARAYGGYQHRDQLLSFGLTSRQIDSRVRRGWLIWEYRCVYAVGHRPVLPVDRAHGVLLAAGPKAVLSHRSAASLWGLVKDWRFPFEVTTPANRRVKGITIHRSRTLLRRDITIQLGVRTTTMARTIFDLAPRFTARELERAVDSALHTPFLKIEQLHELISRLPHTTAARRLGALLQPGHRPTRSELERCYRQWCRACDIPLGLINYRLNGKEVDVYYPELRLIVELDSMSSTPIRRRSTAIAGGTASTSPTDWPRFGSPGKRSILTRSARLSCSARSSLSGRAARDRPRRSSSTRRMGRRRPPP